MIKPNKIKEKFGGIHELYFFRNGYGASVIKYHGSLGFNTNKYELMVIKKVDKITPFKTICIDDNNNNYWDTCYDTKITDDVIGYLSVDELQKILAQIKEL